MKLLIINGSPREKGNTAQALKYMAGIFKENGIETVTFNVPNDLPGCKACYACAKLKKCVIDNDLVNQAAEVWKDCDGLLVGTPVYYAGMGGALKNFMDRFWFSSRELEKTGRVTGTIACVRRAGATNALDDVNHYLLQGGATLVGSTYWPMLFGFKQGEMVQDTEGMHAAEVLAKNMIFAMKSYELGKKEFGLPTYSENKMMNFIR